jgi:hypothetical protein
VAATVAIVGGFIWFKIDPGKGLKA